MDHQDKVVEKAKVAETDVQQELTVKTNGTGTKTRLNVVGKDKATGQIKVKEAKASDKAPLTPNQTVGHPDIKQNGATVVGKGTVGAMSISETDKIDVIGIDSASGDVILTVSDHLDWEDVGTHLLQLQEKLNTYLAFIESGEMLESYPKSAG